MKCKNSRHEKSSYSLSTYLFTCVITAVACPVLVLPSVMMRDGGGVGFTIFCFDMASSFNV